MGVRTAATSHCEITVLDHVNKTTRTTVSPQSTKEALENHGLLSRVKSFIEDCCYLHTPDQPAVGAAIRHGNGVVKVCFYPETDDLETARITLQEVLDGTWKGWP